MKGKGDGASPSSSSVKLEDYHCVGSGSPTGRLGNLLHLSVVAEDDDSLTAAHSIVDVEDVRFDLISHPVLGALSHLQHVEDGTRISIAPFD